MRELNVNEIEQVSGGRRIRWLITAYEVISSIDWGTAEDTTLAP